MVTYRTDGAWGPGVGANLAPAQVDGNFYELDTRTKTLEQHPVQPVQISSFQSVGNQLFIYMSEGTVQGPITLPEVSWYFRGNWAPSTAYAIDDVFSGPDGGAYIVTYAHTSATSFDPGANDGHGHDYYGVLLKPAASTLPTGGVAGTVLTKASDSDFVVAWAPVPVPPGGRAGQVLMKFTDAPGDASWDWQSLSRLLDVFIGAFYPLTDGDYLRWSANEQQWTNQPRAMSNVVQDSSWDPVVGDEGSFMVLTNGTADTLITIPNDSTQPFAIGSELHVHQDGTGKVMIDGEPGVTILKHASFTTQLLGQYATATVKKTATNEWRLFGLLAGA